ncbi:MAG: ABC transporter substrate-binding protein [Microthrixaceae bacterium]
MRITLLRTVAALPLGAGLLTGCGMGGTDVPGELRVVVQSEPTSMNPVLAPHLDRRVLNAVFDPLVHVDEETHELTDQGLITSWSQETPTRWVLSVRPGVRFHDGETLTPESVAFTILENRDNPGSIQGAFYDVVESAVPRAASSVVVTTTEPYSPLPYLLATTSALPVEHYRSVGAEGFAMDPVGTGPFTLEALRSGQAVEVFRNEDYWRGTPPLERIRFSWSADGSARNNLLRSGEADFVFDLPPQFVESVGEADGYEVFTGESDYRLVLFFDATKAPFDDPVLREAVSKAINRDGLVKAVFQGTGAVASNQFIGDLLDEPRELQATYSVSEARRILRESGKAGTRITLGHTMGKSPGDSQVGPAVAGMLEEIGFEVEESGQEYGRFRELRDSGQFDAFIFETLPIFRHPDALASYYVGGGAAVQTCPEPKRYDALMATALAAVTPAEGDAAWAAVEELAVVEHKCLVPVTRSVQAYGLDEDVAGFVSTPVDVLPDYFLLSKG